MLVIIISTLYCSQAETIEADSIECSDHEPNKMTENRENSEHERNEMTDGQFLRKKLKHSV